MPDRYCRNCGQELEADDRFCPNCGRPVRETAHVPTPEADIPVPTPPPASGGADAPSQAEPGSGEQSKHASRIFVGVLVVIVLFGIYLASGEGGGSANQARSNDGPNGAPENVEGSGENFTRENFAQLVSEPDAHEGAPVDVTGRVFTTPEIVEGDTAFQMFVDPENSEMNTAVLARGTDLGLDVDDYVQVVGTVQGSMEGENAFGGTVSAVVVEASEVQHVSAVSAVDPTQQRVKVGRTIADQGFSVTLKKIEVGEQTTRVHVTVNNGTGTGASFYDYDAKIIQGSRQFDQETTYDYEVKAPQSELRPGVRTEGIVTFGKINPSQPLQVRFEWYSDDYNVTAHPIVFQVSP